MLLGAIFAATFQLGADTVVAALVGALAGAPVIANAFDRRRQAVSSTWRELAEGRAAQVDELERKVAVLEARLDVLSGEFVTRMAHEVSVAVTEALERGADVQT